MKRLLLIALIATMIFTIPLMADDVNEDGWSSMLVPIAFASTQTLPGAHGTVWANEIWFRNSSAMNIGSLQETGICMPTCVVAYPAGSLGRVLSVHSNFNNGAMFQVLTPIAEQVQFSARLLELSRNSQPTGVEIPIVRESEFFREERWLLGIPSSEEVRSALRIYDPRALPGTAVAVDFVGEDGTVIASKTFHPGNDPQVLDPAQASGPAHVPTVAISLDLTNEFPVLAEQERFHVRLRPVQEGREFWAMVSVTHNDTQHVLLITSQP